MNRIKKSQMTIAAASVATIALSSFLASCEGRKMSNMEPLGETVEVVIEQPADSVATVSLPTDTI